MTTIDYLDHLFLRFVLRAACCMGHPLASQLVAVILWYYPKLSFIILLSMRCLPSWDLIGTLQDILMLTPNVVCILIGNLFQIHPVICVLLETLVVCLLAYFKVSKSMILWAYQLQKTWTYCMWVIPHLFMRSVIITILIHLDIVTQPKNTVTSDNIKSVAVIICSHNEGNLLKQCVDSIIKCRQFAYSKLQSDASNINIQIVVADSASTDDSMDSIKDIVDQIVPCKIGKLTTRHQAISAVGDDIDIIVAADADQTYGEQWLFNMISPIINSDDEIIGVVEPGNNVRTFHGPWVIPYNGGSSSFLRRCYFLNPFHIECNQTDFVTVWTEEEWRFGLNMNSYGRVAWAPIASDGNFRNDNLIKRFILRGWGIKMRQF